MASQRVYLLWQQVVQVVVVAQAAEACIAPAPESAVGGDGEAVGASSRHSNDMLPFQGLDLAGPRSVSFGSVAEAAGLSLAP